MCYFLFESSENRSYTISYKIGGFDGAIRVLVKRLWFWTLGRRNVNGGIPTTIKIDFSVIEKPTSVKRF